MEIMEGASRIRDLYVQQASIAISEYDGFADLTYHKYTQHPPDAEL